jgi:hypothetical protein
LGHGGRDILLLNNLFFYIGLLFLKTGDKKMVFKRVLFSILEETNFLTSTREGGGYVFISG